jgi:hypothetical protein
MPNIREFDAPALDIRPSEIGVEATAAAARRGGAFFNQAGQAYDSIGQRAGSAIRDAGDVAVQQISHQEITHGAATFAQLHADLTDKWNETVKNADPNDTSVAGKFNETVLQPALDKFQQAFNTEPGQKWAEGRIDALRDHMFQRASADMSTLAGDAVAVNVRKMSNAWSNAAINDPSSVPFLLNNADASIGGVVDSSPGLKGTAAAKVKNEILQKTKEDIVKSGAIGAIAKSANPEAAADEFAKRYPDYINGAEVKMLAANARQQIRAARIDQSYADHVQTKAEQQASDARETQYLQSVYSDDPNEQAKVTTKAIVNDPTLNRVAKERMINLVNREMKPETDAKVSAQSSAEIFRQMRDPNADPDKVRGMIFDARAKDPGTPGSINKADFADLQKQLEDIKTPQGVALASDRNEFFKRYAGTIDGYLPQAGTHSALGQQRMYAAEKDAIRQERALKAAGQDPQSIYDPTSPNFFGRPENMARYHISMDDAVKYNQELAKSSAGNTAAVTPLPIASENKNYFSSGRASTEGIRFNPSTDLTPIQTSTGQSAQVNKYAAPSFQGFLDALEKEGYHVESLGGYADRNKRGGSTPSEHAFGNAIDINPNRNPFHSGKTDLPANVAELAGRYGLIWGGNWKGTSNDPMHFEWTGKSGQQQPAAPQRITSAAEYGTLAPGARYMAPDGTVRVKGPR